jgi:hypothetical protein
MSENQMTFEERIEKEKETNEELRKVHNVEDTPFTVVEHDGKFFLALGRWRLSGDYDKLEDAKDETNNVSWDMLIKVIYSVASDVVQFDVEQVKNITK